MSRTIGPVMLAALCLGAVAPAAEIRWQSGTVTTTFASPATVAQQLATLASTAPREAQGTRIVVQFDRPVTPGERAALAQAGLSLLTYVGDHAYFAAVSPDVDPSAVAKVESLRAALPIQPAWKLHPTLARNETVPWAIVSPRVDENADEVQPSLATKELVVAAYVLFHPDVRLDTEALAVVYRHRAAVRSWLVTINGLVIELPQAEIAALADEPAVQWIEPPLPPMGETNNSNRARTGANIVQEPPFGLDGTGVKVMVYDGGAVSTTHQDLVGRVTVRDGAALGDHPTHVAGTIGGTGFVSGGAYRGMAPNVTFESYEFTTDGPLAAGFLYTDPGDLEQDYYDAFVNQGVAVANNSIGSNVAPNGFPCDWEGNYGATAALIDAIVRGGFGIPVRTIWANGNERGSGACGTTYNTTAPPAGAKNHITVGALNSNDDSVTSFTSWGPVDDGRMKPDFAAPGCQSNDDQGVTSCSSSGNYNVKCGTSMATPTVTGLAALLIQDFRAHYPLEPDFRNSTLKALFAHTAQDVANPGPDYQTGFGSVRIVPALETMRAGNFLEATVAHGETRPSLLLVPVGATEARVTLAWDDYPAAANAIVTLVNDVDVRVIGPDDTVYYPWTLNPASPATPAVRTAADRRNNIEQVLIDNPAPGAYRIEVIGFNVPQGGPQTYSLVGTPTLVDCTPAGLVRLDRVAYTCEGTVTITVNDCGLNTNNEIVETATVTATSELEPAGETVLLTETGPETATFRGTLPLSATNSAGVLFVAEGNTVTVTYIDADNGAGGTNVPIVATAPVDCTLPTVSNVAVVDLGPRSARVTFNTSEPARAVVRYGLSCGALNESVAAEGYNTSHSILLSGLTDETAYFFVLEVTDQAGNLRIDDNGGACHTFTTPDIPDYFTEQFFVGLDLAYHTLEFTPNASVDYYAACVTPSLHLPTDPTGGTALSLTDDGSAAVGLMSGATVALYGTSYAVFYVNANGNITFDVVDSDASESYADHFDNPRVSALFDDLNPASRGQVSWKQTTDRVAVTWLGVTEDGAWNSNTFQIELFFDGRIRITWLGVDAADSIVGLSQGLDLPIDFLASDLSALPDCGPRPPSAASDLAVVGANREAELTLRAIDDGEPVPPGAIAYRITSLPQHELRDGSNGYVIQAVDLPYTLMNGGNRLFYSSTGFTGLDPFTFVADDGGTPPTGGASNVATFTVQVNPVLSVPFYDPFPTTTFDSGKWQTVFNATIDSAGLGIPSPPYAARLNGQPLGIDELTSHLVDLAGLEAVRLSYAWERTGSGESPDSGENLVVEFYNAAGDWEELIQYAGDGEDMTLFAIEQLLLPPSALHESFQLRFHVTGTSGTSPYDDWFIDDVSLTLADAPFAETSNVTVEVDTPRDIALLATDPNLDPLTFVIATLPTHGTLADPAGGVISGAALPYTLIGGGNVARYTPNAGYAGPDSFVFYASDGTYDSNLATIVIAVEPILALPVQDSFATLTFNPQTWAVVTGATIDTVGTAEPSAPYSARFSARDLLQTYAVALSGISPVRLHYYWERTGGGDSPETGDDLLVEYLDATGIWRILNRHEGAGADMTTFELADILLPAGALHDEFRLRFRNLSTGTSGDDYFVDDLLLFLPLAPVAYDEAQQIPKFAYTTVELDAVDPNLDPLEMIVLTLPGEGELIDFAANELITAGMLPYTLFNGGRLLQYYPPLGFVGTAALTFQATDGTYASNVAQVTVQVLAPQFAYDFNLDVNPGWGVQGQWAWGTPLGQFGDPTSGYTGTKIYGYNLGGRYGNNIPAYYLTTTAVDCSTLVDVQLEFRRWLGVEESFYDHANIQASVNGSTWTTVWEHAGATINEHAWYPMTYDLSAVADRQATVYLRWGMGPTDGGFALHGWNIDDIRITGGLTPENGDLDGNGAVDLIDHRGFLACYAGDGQLPQPPPPMLPADCQDAFDLDDDGDVDCNDWVEFLILWTAGPPDPLPPPDCSDAGDLNCDGSVDFGDINPFVLYLSNPSAWQAAHPGCDAANGDINQDGTYPSFGDISAFVTLLSGGG